MSTNAPPGAVAGLEPALRGILGNALTPGGAALAVDGLAPRFVTAPASAEELAAVLAAANERGAAVIPWGGGRHMSLGNVPARYDIALRTTKLDSVPEHEPADLTVAVGAGMTMARLQALLAEHGQFLPIDAPKDSTAGGVLAANASGPSRHAYGLPRDWLLGCRIALADGSIAMGGGRVVKNVAGYDLPRLCVGSLGTLGVIVEATFKVAPLPAAQETRLWSCPSIETAAEAAFAADERGLALRAVAILADRDNEATAAFWLAGPRAAVERTARELSELVRGTETRLLEAGDSERWWAGLTEDRAGFKPDVALKASLPPSAVVGFVRRLGALGHEAGVPSDGLAYPTTGLVLADLGEAAAEQQAGVIDEARREATEAGGSLLVLVAPLAVKERLDVWGEPGDARSLMRRLKQQFDPLGTLNPGRFAGGL